MKFLQTWFTRRETDGLRSHDGELAKQLVGEGAVLLDVRSPAEFASGHLAGALNIPHTELAIRMHELRSAQGNDPNKAIVIYCRSGGRSATAKRLMKSAGVKYVLDLGGMYNWPTE